MIQINKYGKMFTYKSFFSSLLLIILFSTPSFSQYYTLHRTMGGHTGWVWSLAYSPIKDNIIASCSADNTIKLWDISMGICVSTMRGHSLDVYSVAFSPDGQMLVSGSEDSTVKIWDARTGRCLNTFREHKAWVHGVSFSKDGRFVASASGDNTCRVWDIDSGVCIAKLVGHKGAIWAVAFSPDGKLLATGSSDNTVKIWNIEKQEVISDLKGHKGAVRCVAFNPSGALLASGGRDNVIIIWRVKTGENLMTLQGHKGWVESVLFTPTGLKLISTSEDRSTRVWSVTTGKCTQVLAHHEREVLSSAMNRKGTRLATGSCDNKINVWRPLRLYRYTNYYRLKINDKIYQVIEVEYPGEPRGKVVIDEEGRPIKDKVILEKVLDAGDMIGFYIEPENREERFKYFIGSEVEPRMGALNMFLYEIPNNELMTWWRTEKYAAQIISATKSAFLIGSEMAKKIKYKVPYEYAELSIEKFLKDPTMFFTALCQDVIVDGMRRLMWVEAKCDEVRDDVAIDVKDYNMISDAYWDAVVYASTMDYIYNRLEGGLITDLTKIVKSKKSDVMTLLKEPNKPVSAAEIGIKFGEIIANSRVYSEYHKEVKMRWQLKQKELSEIWKKERIQRAIELADKVGKGL